MSHVKAYRRAHLWIAAALALSLAACSDEEPAPAPVPAAEASPESTTAEVTELEMLDIVKMDPEGAADVLESYLPDDWSVEVNVNVSFAKNAIGLVTATDPAAGEPVADGDTIEVQATYPFVPDFIGKLPSSANKFEHMGYVIKTREKIGEPVGKVIAQDPKPGAKALPGDTITLIVGKEKPLTVSQENAIESALDYLEFSSFSREGLIEQLVFEKFSRADATLAVDHIKVDWNKQAAKSARDYLEFSSFSRQGLIDQLVFEGFTLAQATYGVNQTGL
jgi:hypothetical protein